MYLCNRSVVLCCRRCIPRGLSQQPLSLMCLAWGSWSLRLPQTIGHLSSELKMKVCFISFLCHICDHIYISILICAHHDLLKAYVCLSADERNEWVTELRNCTGGPKRPITLIAGSPLTPDYFGYLELRGLRSKLFTVVASDKVLLYKSADVRDFLGQINMYSILAFFYSNNCSRKVNELFFHPFSGLKLILFSLVMKEITLHLPSRIIASEWESHLLTWTLEMWKTQIVVVLISPHLTAYSGNLIRFI